MTGTSCFVYKVIKDLESIDHLCINPISLSSSGVYKFIFYLKNYKQNTMSLSLFAGRTEEYSSLDKIFKIVISEVY